jgi:hypothetical protein
MLSDVPTPLVDCNVRDEDAVVPPIRSGVVSEVVSVGEAEYEGAAPTPPEIKTDPVATSASFDKAVELEA